MPIYEFTEIELYTIERVKQIRKALKISQPVLSRGMGFTRSFIGHVETRSKRAKYNINHLNTIAKILNCSVKDFFPEKALGEKPSD